MKLETELNIALTEFFRPIVTQCVQEAIQRIGPPPTTAPDEVGGIELAQKVTRLSAARIYTLVSERKLPHKKRGNRLTFRRSELLEWLDEGNRQIISQIDADFITLNSRKGGRKSA